MEIRQAYVKTLADLMQTNDKIVVLDADLASCSGTKAVYGKYPERCINVGVAEANMTSMAVGLSAYGFVPFIHSFAPFASRRNFDQIAVGISYSNQNIKIVALDPGIISAHNGGTHMCFEDIALMRALPNVTIVDIADFVQIQKLLPQIAAHNGAVYIRLPRKSTEQFFDENYNPTLGKIDKLIEGTDLTMVVSGALVFEAEKAAKQLIEQGVSVELLCVHTIKPLDEQAILASALKTGAVLTVENHSVHGGLFSSVCELLSSQHPTPCDAIAIFDKSAQVGTVSELLQDYNLTAADISTKANLLLSRK